MKTIKSISNAAKRISRYPANVKDVKLTKDGLESDTGIERFKLEFQVVRGLETSRRVANYIIEFRSSGKDVIVDFVGEHGQDALDSRIELVNTFDVLRDIAKAKRYINSGALERTSGINIPISAFDYADKSNLDLVNSALDQALTLQAKMSLPF